MLSVIGFFVVRIISIMIEFMFINTRSKNDSNLNDATTAFFEGFTWRPIGILSGLKPREQSLDEGAERIIGGIRMVLEQISSVIPRLNAALIKQIELKKQMTQALTSKGK